MKECKKNPSKRLLNQDYVQGSFNQGNAMFLETAGIQCACMALFVISYSTLKKVN